MQIHINGTLVQNHEACPADLKYDEDRIWKKEDELTFSIQLGLNEFHQRTHKLFESFRSEMQRDVVDESEGKEYPELIEYERKNHPELDYLFIDHPELFTKLCKYLGFDLLIEISAPEPNFEGLKYNLKHLSNVQVDKGVIEFKGIALELIK